MDISVNPKHLSLYQKSLLVSRSAVKHFNIITGKCMYSEVVFTILHIFIPFYNCKRLHIINCYE